MLSFISVFSYTLSFVALFFLARRDLKEYVLPDILNLSLALFFLSFHISTDWTLITAQDSLMGASVITILLLTIRAIANRIYKTDALGLGDVKLMAAAGFGLGLTHVLTALIIGALIGAGQGVYMSWRQKQPLARTQVPAGVGFAIGIGLTILYAFGLTWTKI